MTTTLDNAYLSRLYDDALEVKGQVLRWRDALSKHQITWHPAPGSWSIAQCLDHLRISTEQYSPRIEALIERLQARDTDRHDAPYRSTVVGGFLLKFVQPVYRTKLKAPKLFQPDAVDVPASVLEQFANQQDGLLELIRRADGCDLNRGKLASPVSSLVRLTLGDALSVVVTHQRRHLGQARRVIDSEGFPV